MNTKTVDREAAIERARAMLNRPKPPEHLRLASTGENRWKLKPLAFAVQVRWPS